MDIEALDDIQPRTDLRETDDTYVVKLNLAGVTKGDLEIWLAGRQLTISGEHKHRPGILRRQTRSSKRFRYDVLLPGEVGNDGVHANLDHHDLTVTVPRFGAQGVGRSVSGGARRAMSWRTSRRRVGRRRPS